MSETYATRVGLRKPTAPGETPRQLALADLYAAMDAMLADLWTTGKRDAELFATADRQAQSALKRLEQLNCETGAR